MIIDLRDYTTTAGNRDRLIERCEQMLFPEQIRLGATILGTFRDAEHPNRWIWLRGMPSMAERQRILTDFYTNGAMWKAQRHEVNTWIADSSNVLLLRPLAPLDTTAIGESVVGMYSMLHTIPLDLPTTMAWQQQMSTAIATAGGRLIATFATDPSTNNYPRHPIRQGVHGIVWFASYSIGCSRPQGIDGIESRHLIPTTHSIMR